MSSIKARIRAAAARGRSGMTGIRPVLLGAVAGAVVGAVDSKLSSASTSGGTGYPQTFIDHPSLKPAVVAVAAYFVGRRSPAIGAGLAGAAGSMLGAQLMNQYGNGTTTQTQSLAMGLPMAPRVGAGALPMGFGSRVGAGQVPAYAGYG